MSIRGLIRKASRLDGISKIALINLVFCLTYILIILLLDPIMIPRQGRQNVILEIVSFRDHEHISLTLTTWLFSVIVSSIFALVIRREETKGDVTAHDLALIMEMLSHEEQELLSKIQEAKEITQDSLKFRLGWSRAKISSLLTNLERRNVIQRRREGKTYVVFLTRKK